MTVRLPPDMLVPLGGGRATPGENPGLPCTPFSYLDTLSLSLHICEMGVSTVPFLQGSGTINWKDSIRNTLFF